MQDLLSRFYPNTLSICIYHRVSKAQPRVHVASCQDPLVAPRATSVSHTCQLRSGPSTQGIGHIAICTLSLPFWQTAPLSLAFCASEGARGQYLHSAHVCIAAAPTSALPWTYLGASDRGSQSPPNLEGSADETCPPATHPSDSHRAVPRTGVPATGQVSVALLPEHRARPWATAQE